MKTKLTLTVDEDILRRTKRLAKRRQTSVSSLFEQWSTRDLEQSNTAPLSETLLGKWSNNDMEDPRLEYLLGKHAK